LTGSDKAAYLAGEPASDARFVPTFAHSLEHSGGYAAEEASRVARSLLPDVLRYEATRPASYPSNGRTLADDVMDVFISMLTNGKITRDNVGPHNDLLAEFPYLGPPHEDRQGEHPLALAAFGSISPEGIEWRPFPAFPPSARLAVVVGNPSAQGLYTVRVKVPNGVKLMPHRHPEDRVYTVISGVFYIGVGDRFDAAKLQAYPPGSVVVLPGNTSHFHSAKSGEYVTQVSGIGPLGIDYVDPADDPRHHSE
jgi:quercetin dioxygenase-like cupin family protein